MGKFADDRSIELLIEGSTFPKSQLWAKETDTSLALTKSMAEPDRPTVTNEQSP